MHEKEKNNPIDLNLLNSEAFAHTVAEISKQVIDTGIFPKETFGFDNEKMDVLYGHAYRLYQTGKYQESIQIFRLLTVLGAKESKYYLGLAACFHMLKEFENANQCYTLAGVLNPNNPIPYFHSSDCYLQMNKKAAAIFCLDMAVARAGSNPEFQILKDRAVLTINSLKKELLEMGKTK